MSTKRDGAPSQLNANLARFNTWLEMEGVSQDDPRAKIARSIYMQESSGGRNKATSNQDAWGGMQVIPATFKSMADKGWDITNDEHNGRAGIRYIKQLHEQSGGVPALTATGYYSGYGGMQAAMKGDRRYDKKNPGAPDSIEYGEEVWARAQGLPLPPRRERAMGEPGYGYVRGKPGPSSSLLASATAPAGGAAAKTAMAAQTPPLPDINANYIPSGQGAMALGPQDQPAPLLPPPQAYPQLVQGQDPWMAFQANMPRREQPSGMDLNYGLPTGGPVMPQMNQPVTVAGAVPQAQQLNFNAFQSWMHPGPAQQRRG